MFPIVYNISSILGTIIVILFLKIIITTYNNYKTNKLIFLLNNKKYKKIVNVNI